MSDKDRMQKNTLGADNKFIPGFEVSRSRILVIFYAKQLGGSKIQFSPQETNGKKSTFSVCVFIYFKIEFLGTQ